MHYCILGLKKNSMILKGAGDRLDGKAIINIRNIGNKMEEFTFNMLGSESDFELHEGLNDVTNGPVMLGANETKALTVSCIRSEVGQVDVRISAVGLSDQNAHDIGSVVCVVGDELLRPFTFKYDIGEKQIAQTYHGKDFNIVNQLNENNAVVSYIINTSPVAEMISVRFSEALKVYYNGLSQPLLSVPVAPEGQNKIEIKCNKDADDVYGYVVYEDENGDIIDTHSVECINQEDRDILRFEGATFHHIETTVGSVTQDAYRATLTNLGKTIKHLEFEYDSDLFEISNEIRVIGVSENIDPVSSMNLRIKCNSDGIKQVSGDVKIKSGADVFDVQIACDVDRELRNSLSLNGLDGTLELTDGHYFTVYNNGQTTQWIKFITTNPNVKVSRYMVDFVKDDLLTVNMNENLLMDIHCDWNEESEDNYVSLLVLKNRVFHAEKTVKVNCRNGATSRRSLRG